MPESLESLSHQERQEVLPLLRPIMARYGIPTLLQFSYSAEASEAAIQMLNEQLAVNPNRASLQFIITFLYARQHRFADALDAAKRLEELQPRSPRGAYLQANIDNSLLPAAYLRMSDSPEWIAHLQAMGQQRSGESGVSIAPLESQAELNKLGITLEESAQRGYNLAHRVLQHNVHPYDRKVMITVADHCREINPNVRIVAISRSPGGINRVAAIFLGAILVAILLWLTLETV